MANLRVGANYVGSTTAASAELAALWQCSACSTSRNHPMTNHIINLVACRGSLAAIRALVASRGGCPGCPGCSGCPGCPSAQAVTAAPVAVTALAVPAALAVAVRCATCPTQVYLLQAAAKARLGRRALCLIPHAGPGRQPRFQRKP